MASAAGDRIGIPSLPPYESTGLASALEQNQPEPNNRLVGIYYQELNGTIQKLIESVVGREYFQPLGTAPLKLGTPLAAVYVASPPIPSTQIYAVTENFDGEKNKTSIIETVSNEVVVLAALENTKLAAITDDSTTRIFYQPEDKENEIAQARLGSREEEVIVTNAIKGTNIGALENRENLEFLSFDRCLAYHGQDSDVHFWWTNNGVVQTDVIPVGPKFPNSAIAVTTTINKIVAYYQDENAELYYIVKSNNFGFNWGEPQKLQSVPEKPRPGTALTVTTSENKTENLLSYQDIHNKIQVIHHRI